MTKTIALRLSLMAGLLVAVPCAAQDQAPSEPGITGWFELNSFHPGSTPDDGFALERAQVLEHLQLGLGTYFQVDDNPLTWQREEDGERTETAVEIERQLVFHLDGAFGLFGFLQLGVQLPIYIDRGLAGGSPGGIGDTRVIPKLAWRFNPKRVGVGIAASLPVSFPSGEETAFTGEGGVAFEPRLALDLVFGRFRLVGNGGALIKEGDGAYGLGRGKELFGGIGGDLRFESSMGDLHILAELTVATQAHDFFGAQATPVELLGGLRYVFTSGLSLSGAVGTGLSSGVGAPVVRMLLGLGFVPRPFGEAEKEARTEEAEKAKWAPVDTDGDGAMDFEDFCKTEAEDFDGFEDEDGCPDEDNDGDGIRDVHDECPLEPESPNGIDDADGCPEKDRDRDGIVDAKDRCPKMAEDLDGIDDTDGCPDEDWDWDGIPDAKDQCPLLPESTEKGAVKDGCPDTFSLVGDRVSLKARFEFVKRRTGITAWGRWIIADLAAAAIVHKDWSRIGIRVHTSGAGDREENLLLSEERAVAIMKALVEKGVAADRLVAEGVGDNEPIDSPKTAEGRQANERVEISIVTEVPK